MASQQAEAVVSHDHIWRMAENSHVEESCAQVEEDVEIETGVLVGRVVSVSRQYRNTLQHTGLMRWESSLPLARFLLALPPLTQGMTPCTTLHADSQHARSQQLSCFCWLCCKS